MVLVTATTKLAKAIEDSASIPEAAAYLALKERMESQEALDTLTAAERAVNLLVPLNLVRLVAKHQGVSIESLLRGNGKETDESDSSQLQICVEKVELTDQRIAMRRRVKQIDAYVEDKNYHAMTKNVNRDDIAPFDADKSKTRRRGKETFATFMKDIGVGLDVRLMSFAGGVTGYWVCYARGQAKETCIVGAAVGAIIMLFIDAILLIFRISHEDEEEKRKGTKEMRKSMKTAVAANSNSSSKPAQAVIAESKKTR